MKETKKIIVTKEEEGKRADLFLSQKFSLSRHQIQKMMKSEETMRNNRPIAPADKVRAGDEIVLTFYSPTELEAKPEQIPIQVLYEDDSIAVIDKPAELVVHAAAGHPSGTLVNALLYHLKNLSGVGGKLRPGIVHRLDKGTSGVMLIAKSNKAHLELTRQFQERIIEKTYLAIAYGKFKKESGVIKNFLGRSRANRKKISSKTRQGKEAITEWKVIQPDLSDSAREGVEKLSVVELKPKTGRTHQIRVHLAEAGHPIIGDPLYGGKQWFEKLPADLKKSIERLNRQALHAWKIQFVHPVTEKTMEFIAETPDDMKEVMSYLSHHFSFDKK